MIPRGVRRSALGWIFDTLYRFGHRLYDPLTVIFFGREWHRWRQTVLPWVRSGRTLEIGCGTGILLPELAAISTHVVGLDLTPAMLTAARSRTHGQNIELVRADGGFLPFRSGTVETVVATFPAGYIAQQQTLDEIARVLSPGGTFMAVVSAKFTRIQWRRPFIQPLLRLVYGTSKSMNRWPNDLLDHIDLDGQWHNLPTSEGTAFVWVACKRSD